MKMFDKNQSALLILVRKALWNSKEALPILTKEDWEAIGRSAWEQGVLWLAYLGAKCYKTQIPAKQLKEWRSVLHSGIFYNDQKNEVQVRLVQWLSEKKIRAVILKGTSCSRYYPYPEARPLGDIDVLVDKENMTAVGKYLEEQGYFRAQYEHGFHVEYYGQNATIEVHYASTDVPKSIGGMIVAEEMKRFLDDTQLVSIGNMTFPVLSDIHQTLMLLLHLERHMIDEGIGLRQLCDWMMFVNGTATNEGKKDVLELLSQCGMLVYAKVLTKACVNYLGLQPEKAAWCMDVQDELVRALMEEVFRSGNMGLSDKDSMGSLFTDRIQLGKRGYNKLTGLVGKLTELAYLHFPVAHKFKAVLPVLWVYILLRYLYRSMIGLRSGKKFLTIYKTAERRQKLYKELHLYEVKKS